MAFTFLGIQLGSNGCKLQQIVINGDGVPVTKTSDVVFWIVSDIGSGHLYTPVSKLDMEQNSMIVPSQVLAAYNDRTRTLLRKTPKGTSTIPYGGIIVR